MLFIATFCINNGQNRATDVSCDYKMVKGKFSALNWTQLRQFGICINILSWIRGNYQDNYRSQTCYVRWRFKGSTRIYWWIHAMDANTTATNYLAVATVYKNHFHN